MPIRMALRPKARMCGAYPATGYGRINVFGHSQMFFLRKRKTLIHTAFAVFSKNALNRNSLRSILKRVLKTSGIRPHSIKGASKKLLFENACGFSRRKNGKKHRNTTVFRGFLPVLWPERRLAGSDSEAFRSALKSVSKKAGEKSPANKHAVEPTAIF